MAKRKSDPTRAGDYYVHESDEYYIRSKDFEALQDALDWGKRRILNDASLQYFITHAPPGSGNEILYFICSEGCFRFERSVDQIGKALNT